MALGERNFTVTEHRPASFVTEWVAGIVGAVATAVGLWMYHGPADGLLRVQVWAWEWDVSDLSEAWALGAIVLGALTIAAVGARLSDRLSMDGPTTKAYVATAVTIAALALALAYGLMWIL